MNSVTASLAAVTILLAVITESTHGSKTFNLRLSIDEESPKGTIVADMINIFGLLWEERAGRHFKLLDEQLFVSSSPLLRHRSLVEVDRKSGIIKLRRNLDRDRLCGSADECILKVQAMMLPQRVFSLLKLEIVINDLNDNRPTFQTRPIVVNVSEDVSVGDVINLDQYQATDVDSGNNSIINYVISRNEYFDVNQYIDEAGRSHLQLVLLKKLDFESKATRHVTLTATDSGVPALSDHVTVRIRLTDSNDNRPQFERREYIVSLRENLEPGTEISRVQAVDLDSGLNGQLSYFLTADSVGLVSSNLLSVNATSGAVSLREKLDREKHDGLRVEIEARDHGTPQLSSSTWLILQVQDVNDNAPVIKTNIIVTSTESTVYISEASPVGTYIAYVSASDLDHGQNGDVSIRLRTEVSGNEESEFADSRHFALATDGLIGTAMFFNREEQNRYKIIIEACDDGIPQRCSYSNISVEILDENDNAPTFSEPIYEVTLSEDADIGSDVITLTASDDDAINGPVLSKNENEEIVSSTNGQISYSIDSTINTFSIDKKSGRVTLVRPLDREGEDQWEVTVVAQDEGKPSSKRGTCLLRVTVTDVNDNRPLFINPALENSTVHASILRGDIITRIKTVDYDSPEFSQVKLTLLSVDGFGKNEINSGDYPFSYFVLDRKTGDLRLNMSYTNLEDLIGEHHITVEASDSGNPALSSQIGVFIHVSDKLTLPQQMFETTKPTPGLSLDVLIIIISLASAALLLILVISVVLVKCKEDNKKVRTYNCRAAEKENGCAVNRPRSSKHDQEHAVWSKPLDASDVIKAVTSSEARSNESGSSQTTTLSTFAPASATRETTSQSKCRPTHEVTALYSVLPSIQQPATPLHSFSCDEKASHCKVMELIPSMTSLQADRDSGRGDSEADSTSVSGSHDNREYEKGLKYSPTEGSEAQSLKYDQIAFYNNMGTFCTEECLHYGHSDSCWMPANDFPQPPASLLPQQEYNRVLETIRETSPSTETPDMDYNPASMRERVRRSICLSVLASESRSQQPHSNQPGIQHTDELSKHYQLWSDEYSSPPSTVFTSSSDSPAPPCDTLFPASKYDRCDVTRKSPNDVIVHNDNYMAIAAETERLFRSDSDRNYGESLRDTQEMLNDINKLLVE